MKKQYGALFVAGIIAVVAIIPFFLIKNPVNENVPQPCTTSTSTDCLKLTPLGTSYYVPPEVESSVTLPQPTEESTTTSAQSGKIDEHLTIDNTLRDVNFCGKIYQVKQVIIDGVDVVQRVAELATKNLLPETFKVGPLTSEGNLRTVDKERFAKEICENANPSTSLGIINIKWMQKTISNEQALQDEAEVYPLVIDDNLFYIAITSGHIYMTDGFSGTPMGPIGKLKLDT